MTMICPAKNKAELKAKLDAGCYIRFPTPTGERGILSTIAHPCDFQNEPVVLDPETRRRFAQITKLPNGTWRVK